MPLVRDSEIEAFEQRLGEAVRVGSASDFDVIGYGEITVAVKLSTAEGDFVCKRLAPLSSRESAARIADAIARYVSALEACGIDVVETDTPFMQGPYSWVLYCVQPMLAPGSLGPDFLRGKTAEEAAPHVRRIFERIRDSVTPSLAPDGQLSNWAFDGDRLRYFDVGTPFLRDEEGRELFDFTEVVRALPGPIRILVQRFLLKGILDNYHSVRGQALDFLGNLIKEGLGEIFPALIPLANEVFELSPGITEQQVRAHYKSDAQTYALMQAARRADRWVHQRMLRKPYPYLLPPRIERSA
ncbi:MAG: DUF6206 family protein [Polyangiales bacterium]|jgi:hypothetical protein